MANTLSHGGIERIDVSKIDPNPLASRLEQPNLAELSVSFRSQGQLAPIKVRINPKNPGRYQLIYGQRRLIAAQSLGWDRISAEIVKASDEEMLTSALTENLERENYTDYEVAVILRRLHEDFHKSINQIAVILGKSDAYVSQHLTMTSMFDFPSIDTTDATNVLKQLSERQARILLRVADPAERLHLAKICVTEKLGVAQCERFIGHPREVVAHEEGRRMQNWRTTRVKAEQRMTQIVYETLDGLERKDIRPLVAHRLQDSFTLFDDFPPRDLLDYQGAMDHNLSVLRQSDEIRLSHNKLKIHIFGRFAYVTFFVSYQIHYASKWHALRSRVTFVFARKNDDWYIVHEHWSPLRSENDVEPDELEPRAREPHQVIEGATSSSSHWSMFALPSSGHE